MKYLLEIYVERETKSAHPGNVIYGTGSAGYETIRYTIYSPDDEIAASEAKKIVEDCLGKLKMFCWKKIISAQLYRHISSI